MPGSHYDTLGAPATATGEQLRRAYLKRARQLHPDQVVDRPAAERAKAERRMQELNAAWSVLSDPESRRSYDLQLINARPPAGTGRVVSARNKTWKPFDNPRPPAPPKSTGPAVADEKDMEIRGTAKLLRPGPLVALFLSLVGLIIVATLLTGGGSSTARTLPEAEPTGVPVGCISLVPVAESVPCGNHDAVVWTTVGANETCPDEFESIYRQGIGGLFCVTRVQ
ncbi:MAG: J domain-containing protein [Acidimicrobiales bacterium]